MAQQQAKHYLKYKNSAFSGLSLQLPSLLKEARLSFLLVRYSFNWDVIHFMVQFRARFLGAEFKKLASPSPAPDFSPRI